MNVDGRVILVVGADTSCKTQVADALAQALGASELCRLPVSDGVRMFTKKPSSAIVVVDTAPFVEFYLGQQILHEVKRWIAQNALRRMFGKQLHVVCVVSGADAAAEYMSEIPDPNFFLNVFSWLDFLGSFIFPEHKQSIAFVTVNEDENLSDDEALVEKWRMRNFIKTHGFPTTNITHADLRDRASLIDALNSVGNIFRLENSQDIEMRVGSQEPLYLRTLPLDESSICLLGPWVPERVILFGRSGSGKSTLAQMLTSGRLDPNNEDFITSSSIRGETRSIHHGEGRGWYVVDTPGFGEARCGSISTEEATRKVRKYVQMIGGIYTHYIYVVKKDRIDKFEEVLWNFFVLLFGESIKDHFTVVVTNGNKKWVNDNIDHLKACFHGCESFLSADFPPTVENDDEWERECEKIREVSLKKLEYGLTSLQRVDTWCDVGELSKMAIMDGVSTAVFEMHFMKVIQKLINHVRIEMYKVSAALGRLRLRLTPEEEYIVMPEFD